MFSKFAGLFSVFNLKKEEINYEEKLVKNYEKANQLNNSIKFLIIADTHGELQYNQILQNQLMNQEYDLCCALGDISYKDYEVILKYIPKEKLVALLGNHDSFDLLDSLGIKNLNGKTIIVKGIKIGGIEGSFKYKPEKFPSFTHEESIEFLDNMEPVDILISHDGPYIKDNHNAVHDGLKGITKYLYKNRVSYNIHGHNHQTRTSQLMNGTVVREVYLIELLNIE